MDDGELIAQVKSHPVLYDRSHKYHRNKELIANIWANIAAFLETTPDECERRWMTLRGKFNTDRKKFNLLEPGSGSHPTWAHFDSISFLKDHILNRRSYRQKFKNANFPRKLIRIASKSELEDGAQMDIFEPLSPDPFASIPPSCNSPQFQHPEKYTIHKKEQDDDFTSSADMDSNIYTTSSILTKSEDDVDLCFGRMIALELQQVRDESKKKEMKKKIFNVLYS